MINDCFDHWAVSYDIPARVLNGNGPRFVDGLFAAISTYPRDNHFPTQS